METGAVALVLVTFLLMTFAIITLDFCSKNLVLVKFVGTGVTQITFVLTAFIVMTFAQVFWLEGLLS
jgi:hypothetical protein